MTFRSLTCQLALLALWILPGLPAWAQNATALCGGMAAAGDMKISNSTVTTNCIVKLELEGISSRDNVALLRENAKLRNACPTGEYRNKEDERCCPIGQLNVGEHCCPISQTWRRDRCEPLTLEERCAKEEPQACYDLAVRANASHDDDQALLFSEAACARDHQLGCGLAGRLMAKTKSNDLLKECSRLRASCSTNEISSCGVLGAEGLAGRCPIGVNPGTLLGDACKKGDNASCVAISLELIKQKSAESLKLPLMTALEYSRRGCLDNAESALNCLTAGVAGLVTLRPDQVNEFAESARSLSTACKYDIGVACYGLGLLYLDGNRVSKYESRAFVALDRACELQSWNACHLLGTMYMAGDLLKFDRGKAIEYFSRACDGGYARSCASEGVLRASPGKLSMWTLLFGSWSAPESELQRASVRLERGCNGGAPLGCYYLESMRYQGTISGDTSQALAQLRRMCNENTEEYTRTKACQFIYGDEHKILPAFAMTSRLGIFGTYLTYQHDSFHDSAGLSVSLTYRFLEIAEDVLFSSRVRGALMLGLRTVSWPRSDLSTFSLVNLTVGGSVGYEQTYGGGFDTLHSRVGLYAANTIQLTCRVGARVQFTLPMTGFQEVPAISIGIGIGFSDKQNYYNSCGPL